MPPSSSSKHVSHSGKPLSRLNAGAELSASALLAASADASHELDRILRGSKASNHRHRSRSRTKSPHKAVFSEAEREKKHHARVRGDGEEDPFLVHSVKSHTSSSNETPTTQKKHYKSASRSRHRKEEDTPSVTSESTNASNKYHRSHRRESKSRQHRSKSRSLSRTRESSTRREPSRRRHHTSSLHHVSSSSHHRHSSSTPTGVRVPHRSRSRSHSRNRYPDGLAPPLKAVGGGPDYELRHKFVEPFEYEDERYRQQSPPMSPGRLDARAAYEQRRLLELEREEYEYRQMEARELELERMRINGGYGGDPYLDDVRHTYDANVRRTDYGFTGGSLGPNTNDDGFDLDTDGPIHEPPVMSHDMTWAGAGQVLVCGLCECRYEEPGSSSASAVGANPNGKVPRYLLCGHTFCTACIDKLVTAQQDLALARDAGINSNPTRTGVTLDLPCPLGACHPTPITDHGVLSLPINQPFLDVAKFIRSRRAAGHGLKDTGIGRGDERSEEERVKELNNELEADAKLQSSIAASYGLGTSLPCQQCQVHVAALHCQSCNINFCAACSASVHVGRALAEHVKRGLVLPLNVARARGLLATGNGAVGGAHVSPPSLMCPTHTEQTLTLYCRTCQIPVCRDCITPLFKGKHLPPGHDVDLLSTVLQGTTSELKGSVSTIEGTIARIEKHVSSAANQVATVGQRLQDVRSELKESFTLIRTAVLKALAERESSLESELIRKMRLKEDRIHQYRGELAKTLVLAQAAREEGVRVLNSSADEQKHTDIFAIKALLDVRAAIQAGATQSLPAILDSHGGGLNQQDVLLRMRPRDLIRLVEQQISKQGGVIASIPSEPSFIGFAAAGGTSMVVSWAPANAPVEGEVLEYQLEVCELPRGWRSKLRILQPSLFPDPPTPDEDVDEEMKWDGQGPLGDKQRAAVNWLALAPGNVEIGGEDMIWKIAGGAPWAGPFTTLYSGEVTSVKHDNLNIHSSYIYRISVKNDLGSSGYTYSRPCTLPCMHLSYSSDMDGNGLVTYLGSNGGSSPWSNPTVQNLFDITASSIQIGETAGLTSRQAGTFQTLNRHLSWIRFDLARSLPFRMVLTHYTLANCGRGVGVRRVLRNWCLQGSSNGIDWVTLREHVKDATLAPIPLATATWSVTQPTPEPYRYFRIMQTDVNQAADHHLALGQIEFYGWLVRD